MDTSWKDAQSQVAEFLKKSDFSVQEELRLKSNKRIDIVAQKKMPNYFLHVIIEVKDWNNVTRRKEMDFCNQIIGYLLEYAVADLMRREPKDKWNRSSKKFNERFVGILCLTKSAHFSYRKVSNHYLRKNKQILGIPLREQAVEKADLYVARFDFLKKVFDDLEIPIFKEVSLDEWL